MSQRPWNTFFRQNLVQTDDVSHTTTVSLTTRWMTSFVQDMYNNCSWNTTRAHGHRNMVWGDITWLCAICCVWLPIRILSVTVVEGQNKRWVLSRGFLWWGKGNTAFPYFPFCEKRETSDTTPNTSDRVSLPDSDQTSSVETLSLCVCVCSGSSGKLADKAESLFLMRICSKCLKDKQN